MPQPDMYFSADVEADGPIPGPFSMLSTGLCVAGTFDGETFVRTDLRERTFYSELKPISDEFDPAALAVSGLDRDELLVTGTEALEAMRSLSAWIEEVSAGHKAVMTAYPMAYDAMFLHWYLVRFAGSSPFGHSGYMDMKSFYAARANVQWSRANKRNMPKRLLSNLPHTHNALDDAVEQGEMFQNLFTWRP